MLKSRKVHAAPKTHKELCKSVAKRMAKVNPGIEKDVIKRKAKRAVKSLKLIQDLPRHSQIINMTHDQLNLALLECPESPYFARGGWKTNEESARNLVLAFVERASYGSYSPLEEATPSVENKSCSNKEDQD